MFVEEHSVTFAAPPPKVSVCVFLPSGLIRIDHCPLVDDPQLLVALWVGYRAGIGNPLH
jgi:hypothetical protein